MKKHAIIPIFIPHLGCPNDCIFCNQKQITSRSEPVTAEDVKKTVETHLITLSGRGIETVEIAFYGGSFTGIPLGDQSAYLSIAKEFKDLGKIDKIHISTRPDYIDEEILENLKKYGTDIIELGVQSFDEQVLKRSNRGHDSETVKTSAKGIREYGFSLGIQLMTGLPGDTYEKDICSAKEAVALRPDIARIYPVVVLENTELHRLSEAGAYEMLTEQEAVRRAKDMYLILSRGGVNVIRIGLKNTFGFYHPSFRQLVETEAAKEILEAQMKELMLRDGMAVTLYSSVKNFSDMIGNRRSNKIYFAEKYPELTFSFKMKDSLREGSYCAEIE